MQVERPDEKVESLDGVEYRYSSSWIRQLEDEQHWRLYWRQQRLMDGLIGQGDHVLEIGLGTGFTRNYLESRGVHVTTLDIDAEKRPDIVANIVTHPFEEKYEAILAFEVFEHIPFARFCEIIPRIAACCSKGFFFSVPRNRKTPIRFEIKLPTLKSIQWEWNTKRGKLSSRHHFWEIDYEGITEDRLASTLQQAGLHIQRRDEFLHRVFFACCAV